MLKVPKRQMPLLILSTKLAKIFNKRANKNRAECFRAIQDATCMPNVDGQPYLSTLFDIPKIGMSERTMADYFESVTTGESSHVPADTGSIKEFADEFFRQFSLQPFQSRVVGNLESVNPLLRSARIGSSLTLWHSS